MIYEFINDTEKYHRAFFKMNIAIQIWYIRIALLLRNNFKNNSEKKVENNKLYLKINFCIFKKLTFWNYISFETRIGLLCYI